ncbi:cation transporter [Microvirga arabica]|uniref:cation transporter n=1 Tax=Microvirga arabica TaxID=1128671 RepID=UPI00193949B4|nr:cation transporter [Microvirga arabica]MBM1170109.1 cation transporter [Microvirga arabica]
MKTLFRIALTASALMLAGGAMAAPRTVTLEVENVSCVSCAPIVKKALSRVPGVSQVTVIEADGMATATVTFDDEKVTPEALTKATTNAGFPSTVKGSS